MGKKAFSIVFLSVILLSSTVLYTLPSAYANGEAADLALGQSNLISSVSNLAGNSLNAPLSAITDSFGNLWVADANNNRVLRYNSGFVNGATASIVLGQPNVLSNSAGISDTELNSPRGLGIDSATAPGFRRTHRRDPAASLPGLLCCRRNCPRRRERSPGRRRAPAS